MNESTLFPIADLTTWQIASICDHTFLKRTEEYRQNANTVGFHLPKLRERDFHSFLEKTVAMGDKGIVPYAVCVRPEDVGFTKNFLSHRKSPIKIVSVVGFPDGSHYSTDLKLAESKHAIQYGASEIDMVLNYDAFTGGGARYAETEVEEVVKDAHDRGALVKLILETSELSPKQLLLACEMANRTGVDFVKTSTGFSSSGANCEDLELMRDVFRRGVKVSGGVIPDNVNGFLFSASGRTDSYIDLDPRMIRIGAGAAFLEGLCKNL